MGSVEAFPRSPATPPLADRWRAASQPSGIVKVREARLEDYAAIRSLERADDAALPARSLRQFESQRQAFAAGQLVAVCDGAVIGMSSALCIDWRAVGGPWAAITAEGHFTTHDAQGDTLFGSTLAVDPSWRGVAAARALLQARARLCRKLNLRRALAVSRMPGFSGLAASHSPEQYAMRVVAGDLVDASMRLQMTQGYQYCGVIRDYLPDDRASGGHAALFCWINPLFAPPGPPAFEKSERPRKCA